MRRENHTVPVRWSGGTGDGCAVERGGGDESGVIGEERCVDGMGWDGMGWDGMGWDGMGVGD